MLNNERVQQWITQKAVHFLSNELESNVSVENARFELFNKVTLHKVIIDDRQGDTLLIADEISTKFMPLHFLRNQFIFQQLRLTNLSLYLKNDVETGNNFDFFLALFKSKNKNKSKNILFEFKSIQLVNCNIAYTSNKKEHLADNLFDVNNIGVKNLNSRLSIDYFNNDSLSITLQDMNFVEKSGLTVKDFSAQIRGNNKELNINNLNLVLPKTDISTSSLYFNYEKLKNGGNIVDDLFFKIGLKSSEISLGDFAAFLPKLKPISKTFTISGAINGNISNLDCPALVVNYGKKSNLEGNFKFTGLPKLDQTYVSTRISNLYVLKTDFVSFITDLKGSQFAIPKELNAVETVIFTGEMNGYIANDLKATGNLQTNLGNASINMSAKRMYNEKNSFTYSGEVQTTKFRLGKFLDSKDIGDISFNLSLNGEKESKKSPVFDVKGLVAYFQYNNYTYKNIKLDGHYDENKFNGSIDLNDENGNIFINGLLDFSAELPFYDLTARVKNFQPGKMLLTQKYPDMILSFNCNINAKGNRLDNIVGNIFLDSLDIKNNEQVLFVDKFELISEVSENLSSIVISSNFINGVIEGKYNLSTFVSSIRYVASQYLPALNSGSNKALGKQTDNNFDFDLKINNLDSISNLLDLKWATSSDINIFGYYDDQTRKFRVRGIVPFLEYNEKTRLSDIDLVFENPDKAINFGIDFKYEKWNSPSVFNFSMSASAENDSLLTYLQWGNNDSIKYGGNFYAVTHFATNKNEKLMTVTDIFPSEFTLADTLWTIQQSTVIYEPGKVSINNFGLGNDNQNLKINGIASKNSSDKINLTFKNVRLGILEQLVNMSSVALDGYITGAVNVEDIFNIPIIEADLKVEEFSFNQSYWGNLNWLLKWNSSEDRLSSQMTVMDNNKQIVDLSGYIYPKNNIGLDLNIIASDLQISFLQPFLENVLQNIDGRVSTNSLRMIGPLVKPLFDGNVFLKDASIEIDYLKAKFSFSDSLKITPSSFSFKDITIYDPEKHTGKVSGNIEHDSYKNFKFQINGNFNNLLALNTQASSDANFYGKAYGTGNISLNGNSQNTTIDVGVRTEPNTRIVIPLSSYMTATESSFITYINRPVAAAVTADTTTQTHRPFIRRERAQQTKSTMTVNLQIEANDNAEIMLITDPSSGDMIRARGNGNIKLVADGASGLTIFGNYVLESGTYNFTLQNIIPKDFKIKEGSSIRWSGPPYSPEINIVAYYTVTASLLDLFDETELSSFGLGRSTVQINCLLQLSGELTSPNIKFDFELPSNDAELERRIRSVINTDEMMTRQMLYLLAFNRFLRPDYLRNNAGTSSEFSSLVSSTLSAQLNHWLSQIDDNLSMSVNYRDDTQTGLAGRSAGVGVGYEMFNNRLIFSGNVGYREDALSTSNFVGDFDLEYKLNRSGKLRAKAYSHSNDEFYLRNTTTQGVGIIYREDFNNFGQLMRDYWNKIFGKNKDKNQKKKKDKKTQQTDQEKQASENAE
jgi:hypothetical protein